MKKAKICSYLMIPLVLMSLSGAVGAANSQSASKTFVVKRKEATQHLYFTGEIKPLKTVNVTSPAEGVVVEKNFVYGETVKKGDMLIRANSTKLESDYHNALTAYLKAKDAYYVGQAKLKGTEQLWNLGLIPKNEYIGEKSNVASERIAFQQALYSLEETMKRGRPIGEDVKRLKLSDFEAVDKALSVSYNKLSIIAPENGVALLPPKGAGAGSGDATKIVVGSQLKLGQVIAAIGDLEGISIDISVSELDIDKVVVGQEVTITGAAFPDVQLQGEVASIVSQATSSSGLSGGLPTFPVKVIVKQLNEKQRKTIRVGMSAKVQLNIRHENDIMIPISAVFQKGGRSMVQVRKDGSVKEVPVTTGQTSMDSVEIKQGLKDGDVVIIGPK